MWSTALIVFTWQDIRHVVMSCLKHCFGGCSGGKKSDMWRCLGGSIAALAFERVCSFAVAPPRTICFVPFTKVAYLLPRWWSCSQVSCHGGDWLGHSLGHPPGNVVFHQIFMESKRHELNLSRFHEHGGLLHTLQEVRTFLKDSAKGLHRNDPTHAGLNIRWSR